MAMQRREDPPPSPHIAVDERQLPSLPVLITVAVIGAAAGWLVIQASPGAHRGVIAFRHQAWYTVWSSLGSLFVALWLVLGVVTLSQLWSLSLEEEDGRWDRMKLILKPALGYLLFGALVGYLASAISYRSGVGAPDIPLAHSLLRVNFFAGAAIVGSLPSAVGLWVIRRRAGSLPTVALGSQIELLRSLDQFLVFQARNQRFLATLSTVVATAVLQTSAVRNALIGAGIVTATDYPPEFVLLYGVIFAVAVAIVYLPPELALREAGRTLQNIASTQIESTMPTPSNEVERWLEQAGQRDRIGKVLGLDVPIVARVQTSLGLFAPLIASLIGALVPH